MKTIFVDMDGVLTNFEKMYTQVCGMSPKDGRDSKTKGIFRENWNKFIDEGSFKCLEYFPGAEELISTLDSFNVQKVILTSSGGMERHNDVMKQKLFWLSSRGIKWPAIVVPGRRYKAGFATGSDALLIDDTLDVIESFRARGGMAIHHTDVDRTLNVVRQCMQEGFVNG